MKTTEFDFTLGRFQRRWRAGLLLSGFIRATTWLGLTLLALGALDFYAGFSDPGRRLVASLLSTLGAFGILHALWETFAFTQRTAAGEADRSLKSQRREVLSALELQAAPAAAGAPLTNWLRDRALASTARNLGALPFSLAVPTHRLGVATKQLFLLVVVIGICFGVAPTTSRIITQRLLQPGADVPPYSPLKFALGPQPAEVLYGGEILITATITGAKLKDPVRCLTRDPATGKIEESPAFEENGARFSRKLEQVAAPLEIAFAVGRARSTWMPVAVRTQPKVQEVLLTVEPPAYSGLPIREFALGTQELAALPGSHITARILSNRPLSGGTMRIHVAETPGAAKDIAGERTESHRVRFTWIARTAGRISLQIRDVLGTASDPLTLEQKLLKDARPEVVLREPAGDVLATPETELALEGSATDDLGLKRVTFVRQLKGYRERSLPQPVPPGRRFDLTDKLNLAPFGLVAGQTLELLLESADTNPNLLGVSVSEPARIHIITTEKYAEILRAQTTLEEFSSRYEALHEVMEETRKSLEALEQAAKSGDAAAAEEARKKAMEAHQKAAEVFGKIARDFPIFELDNALSKTALDAMSRLFENSKELKDLALARPDELLEALPELIKRLGESEKAMATEMEKGERAVAAGKVMEQAGRFKELIDEQRALVKDYNRALEQIRRGETKAGQALSDLALRQSEIARDLRGIEKELSEAVKELPEEFEAMKKDGAKFMEALRDLEIPPTMDEGTKAAEAADSKTGADRADEALAKLEALLRKKNGICAMCRGGGEQPFPWPQDLSQTLEQLLSALIPKPAGEGEGAGNKPGMGGQGPGGHSESGFLMRGKMPQLPIYGPSRSRFSNQKGALGVGQGTGKGQPTDAAHVEKDQLSDPSANRRSGEAVATEAVPEAYREAVKRYFSSEDLDPPAASK